MVTAGEWIIIATISGFLVFLLAFLISIRYEEWDVIDAIATICIAFAVFLILLMQCFETNRLKKREVEQEYKDILQSASDAISVKDVLSLFVPRPNVAGIDYLDQWYAQTEDVWPKFRDKWLAENPGKHFNEDIPDADFVKCRLEARLCMDQFIEALREASLAFTSLRYQAGADWANIWSGEYDYTTRNIRLIAKGFKAFFTDPDNWSHLRDCTAHGDLADRQKFVRLNIAKGEHWKRMVETLTVFDSDISHSTWPFHPPPSITRRSTVPEGLLVDGL
jgi:hypothetical protein